jgi:hypothetical protein
MKLHALDMPDRHEEVVPWLERHLVGIDLPDLVAELAAVYDAGRVPRGALADVLGGSTPDVLQRGLSALPREQFRRLLTQPFLLFELQELVLTRGSRYWRALESTSEARARAEAEWRKIKAALPAADRGPPPPPPAPPWFARAWPWVLVVLAFAAGFALCFLWLRVWDRAGAAGERPPPQQAAQPPAPWGWNRPDAVAPAASPRAYRDRLADLIEEWKTVAPDPDAANARTQLAARLLELRGGVTRVQLADHPLPEAERAKLQEEARGWGKQIDVLIQNVSEIAPGNLLRSANDLVAGIASDLR